MMLFIGTHSVTTTLNVHSRSRSFVLGFSESLPCTRRLFRQVSLFSIRVSLLHYPINDAILPLNAELLTARTLRLPLNDFTLVSRLRSISVSPIPPL